MSENGKPGTVVQSGSAETLADGETVRFEWRQEYVTPELLCNVGAIVIKWAWLDHEVTAMCDLFWVEAHPEQKLPQSFGARANILQQFGEHLYLAREPEEYRLLAWFLQRSKTVWGKRDDLAHGRFGMITRRGRTCEGFQIPVPGGNTKYIPMSREKIAALSLEIDNLLRESHQVSHALYLARVASSSQQTQRTLIDGVWMQLTWENRSPKLPRENLPPPTWHP